MGLGPRPNTREVLARMAELVPLHGPAAAARKLEKEGLGTAHSICKLWYRYRNF
jgi:hypothetical protein